MLNPNKSFDALKKNIKIKNMADKFYTEMDYIKDLERSVNEHLIKKIFYRLWSKKKFKLYEVSMKNMMREEIQKTAEESQVYKIIYNINASNHLDFSNLNYILQEKSFLNYIVENKYIEKERLENLRELLIEKDFDEKNEYYHLLTKTQRDLKNKLEDIIGN